MLLPDLSVRLTARGCRALCWLSLSALCLSGCAQSPSRSMARMWDQMPTMRWRPMDGHADDPELSTATAAKSRSKAAKSADEDDESRSAQKTLQARKRGKSEDSLPQLAGKQNSSVKDPFLDDEQTSERLAKHDSTKQSSPEVEAVTVSRRKQLKAELDDDARRIAPPEALATEQARLRLRVESTMERARQHVANDELAAAQRAAELAQRLTESGGLEFAPDEERPIELLTDIIARREAEQEKAALATSDEEAQPAEEESPGEQPANIKPATAQRRAVDPTFAINDEEDFDPYARRAAAEQDAAETSSMFNTALVVLEKPSFEEEIAAVNPTDYVSQANGSRRELMLPFVRKSAVHEPELEDIPEPPVDDEATTDEAEVKLVLPSEEAPAESAPMPPALSAGPKLAAATLEELPADLQEVDEPAEEIKSAGALPRWLPLSLLSLMTAGLCVWLWRNRTMLQS